MIADRHAAVGGRLARVPRRAVRRPAAAGGAADRGGDRPRALEDPRRTQRALIGWFGIRGVGSLYYLMAYATERRPRVRRWRRRWRALMPSAPRSPRSLVHGVSVTPLMNLLRARARSSAARKTSTVATSCARKAALRRARRGKACRGARGPATPAEARCCAREDAGVALQAVARGGRARRRPRHRRRLVPARGWRAFGVPARGLGCDAAGRQSGLLHATTASGQDLRGRVRRPSSAPRYWPAAAPAAQRARRPRTRPAGAPPVGVLG